MDKGSDIPSSQVEEMREALKVYAETLCEYGPSSEVCGRLSDDDCFGCRARAIINRNEKRS